MGKNGRNSNIELLRIVSMLLIVAAHGGVIGCYETDAAFDIYVWGQIMCSWGILGVDLFLIISAWFLVDQEFRISKVISIVWTTFTWVSAYLILSVLYVVYNTWDVSAAVLDVVDWMHRGLLKPFWAYTYWFVTAYFFMLLMTPLLNKVIHSASEESLRKTLLILLFIPIYAQFGTGVIGDIIYFGYVYLLVGYIKRYGISILEKFAKPGYIIALSAAIVGAKMIMYLPETTWSAVLKEVMKHSFGALYRHSVVLLVDALLIFLWVIKLKPRCNRLVNKIASCTFGVYLFHGNYIASFPIVGIWAYNRCVKLGIITFSRWFPFGYTLATLLVFSAGTVIEYIRQLTLQKPFMKWLEKHCSGPMAKADQWFNTL